MRLTKHERSFIAKGLPHAPPDRIVTGYEFVGMPSGQRAFANNANAGSLGEGCWQVLRVIDGVQGNWSGEFKTVGALQAVLEDELSGVLV